MGELERILPDEVKNGAVRFGDELVLSYAKAMTAIRIATEHQIAILGVDAFEIRKEGLATAHLFDGSRLVPFTGDWAAHVAVINDASRDWLEHHRLGENYGYILTSASQGELAQAKSQIDNS